MPAVKPATPTIMVFGDSLSAGYGLPQEAGWVSLLKKKLQTQFPAHVINNSISGETASGGRNRIEQALKIHRPDIVIIELGGNDGLRGAPIESIRDNLEAIIEACLRNKATVLLAGMQLPPNYGIASRKSFRIFTRSWRNVISSNWFRSCWTVLATNVSSFRQMESTRMLTHK